MLSRFTWIVVSVWIMGLLGVSGANAQSGLFLIPRDYQPEAPEPVTVAVRYGPLGESVGSIDWPSDRLAWVFVRTAGTQHNLERDRYPRPGTESFPLDVDRVGVVLVGVDLEASVETISGAAFHSLALRQPGVRTKEIDTGTKTVRVRRFESAKTLLRIRDGKSSVSHSATAQSKTGQVVEIRPLADPTAIAIGGDLPLRVYLPDCINARARVVATHVSSGETQTFDVDRSGIGFFRITKEGEWRIEASGMSEAPLDPEADWNIASATLTFEALATRGGR